MVRHSRVLQPMATLAACASVVTLLVAQVPHFGNVFLSPSSSSPRVESRVRMFGVTKQVIQQGDGKNYPKAGDTVTMHYTGTFSSFPGGLFPTKFDSSYDSGEPFVTKIGVGKLVKGVDEGVPQMSLGEKAVLKMTADYAYGPKGFDGLIPPNTDLTFEVELLNIETPWSLR